MADSTFAVRLTFTGACGVVERDSSDGRSALCIVLQNAWSDSPDPKWRKGKIDGKYLRRHRAFMTFPASAVAGVPSLPWPQQAVLDLASVYASFEASGALELKLGELDGLVRLDELVPSYSVVTRYVNTPKPSEVGAFFLVDAGHVTAPVGTKTWKWKDLNGKEESRSLNHQIHVDLGNVKSFKLHFRSVSNPALYHSFDLRPTGRGLAITIANLCDYNPLKWGEAPEVQNEIDEDFRWHYEIIDNPSGLKTALEKNMVSLPIPYRKDMPNGSGWNCYPVRYQNTSYSLDPWTF